LTEGEEQPTLVQEDRNDPHRTLAILYIITIMVGIATALLLPK
jgi:hypothetical protein